MRTCATCGAPINRRNKSGLCKVCVIRDPAMNAKRQAAARRAYQLHPELLEAAADRLRAVTKTPEHADRAREMMVSRKLWIAGAEARGPKGSAACRKIGRSISEKRLAHIPPHLRDEYKALVKSKGFKATEAREIIMAQHEAEMARWHREIGYIPPKPREFRPMPGADVLAAVAEMLDVTREDILGAARHAHIVDARAIIAVVLRSRNKSYPTIGRFLRRDHSSIINLCETFEVRAARNPDLARAVEVLLGEGPEAMAA